MPVLADDDVAVHRDAERLCDVDDGRIDARQMTIFFSPAHQTRRSGIERGRSDLTPPSLKQPKLFGNVDTGLLPLL